MIFCLDDNFNVLSPKGRSCGCGSAVFYQRLNSNVGTCYEFKEVVELFSGDIHSDMTRVWDHRASAMKKTVVPCNIESVPCEARDSSLQRLKTNFVRNDR